MSQIRHLGLKYFLNTIKMTEETTTETGTETTETTSTGNSQEAAFKRLQEKNAELESKLKEKETTIEKTETKVEEKEPDVGSPEYIKEVIKQEATKESTVQKFFSDFPEAKEYEGEIRKRLNDPSRAKIPVDEVIRGSIPLDVIMKMGAKLQQQESESDGKTGMGGSDGKSKTKLTAEQEKNARYHESLPKWAKPKTS